MNDSYDRFWLDVPADERCPTCGQPDNCGDCEHGRLSEKDVVLLGGFSKETVQNMLRKMQAFHPKATIRDATTAVLLSKGSRVELLEDQPNDPCPVRAGDTGTVDMVDDGGTIHVEWDSGRRMGLIVGVDNFRIITR